MKWLKILGSLLGALIVLCGAFLVSGHGILFAVTDATEPATPAHGRLPAWRCHYFTGTGTFSFESNMEAWGDDVCHPVKRPRPSNWKLQRVSFF